MYVTGGLMCMTDTDQVSLSLRWVHKRFTAYSSIDEIKANAGPSITRRVTQAHAPTSRCKR